MFRHLRTRIHPARIVLLIASAFALAFLAMSLETHLVSAHTRINADPYTVVVGWEKEPVVVGDRNAVWLQILDGDTPITKDVKVDLVGTILYGGRTFLAIPLPSREDGVFLIDIFPTVSGTYELQLKGSIGSTEVDLSLDLDEVRPASALQFPQEQPDMVQMQTELQETRAQLRTANLLAIAGLVAGILGIAVGVFSLLRRPG